MGARSTMPWSATSSRSRTNSGLSYQRPSASACTAVSARPAGMSGCSGTWAGARKPGRSDQASAGRHRRNLAAPSAGGQRYIRSGQGLADRAGALGLLRDPGKVLGADALSRPAEGQLDAADPEAARRIRAECHVGGDIELLPAAARRVEQGGELHREARAVRGGDQLLRAGGAVGIVSRPLGEVHLVTANP